jgi:restriction endonuclease Mrr
MPVRDYDLLCQPIVECLRDRDRPAWEIEEELTAQFKVTPAERALTHPKSGQSIWTNDVAFGLKKLMEARTIAHATAKPQRAPNGSRRWVYHLTGKKGLL